MSKFSETLNDYDRAFNSAWDRIKNMTKEQKEASIKESDAFLANHKAAVNAQHGEAKATFEPGTYYLETRYGHDPDVLEVERGARGALTGSTDDSGYAPIKWDSLSGTFRFRGKTFYSTPEDARRRHKPAGGGVPLEFDYKTGRRLSTLPETIAGLRKVIARNHPDKVGAAADLAEYQRAVERLDELRGMR